MASETGTAPPLSRRAFLAGTSTAAALGASALLAPRAHGASERRGIGIIGAGGRGSALMREIQALSEKHNVALTAVWLAWK